MNFLKQIANSTTVDSNKIFQGVDTSSKSLNTGNILNEVFAWAGIICVVVIIVSGFFYVTSAGNPSTLTRAKNAMTYALIGLGLIILAFGIVTFVTEVI